ncbi:MAG: c-type cytochrome, partial [Planctomycetota bacterium]|nr:c-type cytochrome [Planctomycetota bacterium]
FAQDHYAWAVGIAARRTAQLQFIAELDELIATIDQDLRSSVLPSLGDALARVRTAQRTHESPNGFWDILTVPILKASVFQIQALLQDDDPRVRAAAAVAIAKAEPPLPALAQNLISLAAAESEPDPVLRNAAVVSLTAFARSRQGSLGKEPDLVALGRQQKDATSRTVVVVALRRLNSPKVAQFLADTEPAVVTEATRAINDVPIDEATPQLAALADKDDLNDPTLRRVLNANFRLGEKSNAEAIAKVASDKDTPPKLRIEALAELKLWADPPKTDRVTGMYRPIEARDASFVADVVRPMLDEMLAAKDSGVRTAAIELAAAYKIVDAAPMLQKIAADIERGDGERVAALKGLTVMASAGLNDILAKAVEDESAAVRSEARSLWASHDPAAAVPVLDETIRNGETIEKQAAIATLAALGTPEADAILGDLVNRLSGGAVPREIRVDILEAAWARPSLKEEAELYERSVAASGGPLSIWQDSLVGGDAEKGKDIFFNRASVSCQRCHKAENGRGGEVGPDLSKIAEKKDRTYLLEALVTPNSKIAENFESVVVVTTEGQVVTGVKRAEDEESLTLITAEGKGIVIPKDEIEDRAVGKSAMPEDLIKHLSKRDVRDLMEYLASQK